MSVCLSLGLSVLSKKRLELSTPNVVHIYSTAVVRHAERSKGQRSRSRGYENRHGRMTDSGCCGRCATVYCCRRGTARRMTACVSSSQDVSRLSGCH